MFRAERAFWWKPGGLRACSQPLCHPSARSARDSPIHVEPLPGGGALANGVATLSGRQVLGGSAWHRAPRRNIGMTRQCDAALIYHLVGDILPMIVPPFLPMKALCLALSCALFLSGHAWAEQPGPAEATPLVALPDLAWPPAPEYTVECRMIRVPAKALLTLVPAFDDDATAAAAWEKVQGMIARGEATLMADLLAKGEAGRTISAESLEEMTYATNFASSARPPDFHFSRRSAELLKFWPHIGLVPTNFEKLRLGRFLDAQVRRTADPVLLDCAISLRHLEFLGVRQFPAGRLENGERLTYEQPRTSEMKDVSKLLVALGRPVLVGVHPVPGEEEAFELSIVRITGERRKAYGTLASDPWKVKVEMQIVALPVNEARQLIPRLRRAEAAEDAAQEVQGMIADHRAALLGWPTVLLDTSREPVHLGWVDERGEMPKTESFEIVRYPLQFEPAQMMGYGRFGTPRIDIPLSDKLSPSISVPYYFDARNAGHRLEVVASIGSAGRVLLELNYELVALQAMEPALGVRFDRPGGEPIFQPRFSSTQGSANVTLPSGGRALISSVMERGSRLRMILFLLHAVTRPSPSSHP